MLCHWFQSNEEDQGGAALVRLVLTTMKFLFGCFRVKESRSSFTAPEAVISCTKNSLSSLFLCDDDLIRKGEGRDPHPHPQELNVGKLKAESVKRPFSYETPFVVLPLSISARITTPIEIRSESNKVRNESTSVEDEKNSNCKLHLPVSHNEILKLQKESDESTSHVDVPEEWTTETPSSCLTDGDTTERSYSRFMQRDDVQKIMDASDSDETSSVLPEVRESNRFAYSSGHANQHSKHYSRRERMPARYSNPHTFTDAMQIPGTPAGMNTAASGVLNVSSLHEYSDLDPRRNPSKWKELKDECNEASLMSTPMSELTENRLSVEKLHASTSEKKVCPGKTLADRPILGMVAAHWHNDDPCAVSPKWWDGNGIPNSTNKYKEDQKVSWHATPFEERLEKALSEETFISRRKLVIGTYPIEFNESEEADSVPRFQALRQFKPVASF